MNDMQFKTGGDWPSTTLFNNGEEVPAAQLFVQIETARDEFGQPVQGGIYDGIGLTAIVRTQEDPDTAQDILPGRISLDFPGHSIVVENVHPMAEPGATQVWYNGTDVSGRIVDLYVDINALDDIVKAYITLYKTHWIAADEAITYSIMA